ncbi:MAG: penicillin-binding protein 2, partial [Deltaproteobacteria bacterium]|nr:penicillin-binding protein 2 [Deltaproteobacteria bacterium]
MVLVFFLFFLRLVQLQIIEGEDLKRRSERNSIHKQRVEAPRGDIYDRDNRLLATTRPAYGVQVLPSELKRRKVTLSTLAELIGEDYSTLEARVGNPRGRNRFKPIRIAGDLTPDQLARVSTHSYGLPGVITDVRPRRHYLYNKQGAHLFGTLGEIRADQLEARKFTGYRSGEIIGQTGLESILEEHLRGREGGRVVVVDVAGREVDLLEEVDPVPGGSVRLTIDLDLQRAAEEAFDEVEEGKPAKMGALVAMDPRTGDVLAMVSRPAYDPNSFAGGVDTPTWNALNGD